MSEHPSSHYTKDSSSFWSALNVLLAIIMGGGILLISGSFFLKGVWLSSGGKEQTGDLTSAAAAPAPTSPPPSAAAPATPAGASTTAAAAPTASAGGVAEIVIGVDKSNPLGYDTKAFTVKAGQKVRLTFNNSHPIPQPHNIVIAQIGAKEKLFALAMQMATDPQGMTKGYIPDAPEVLFHTKLLQPNTSETIEFTAPVAGQYPYMCTFPGHGAIMNGVMTVE